MLAPSGAQAQSAADTTPAKQLFGGAKEPAELSTRSIGFYSKGCLAGAIALPINGKAWQAMRLSRNRSWGHPALVAFLERFAAKVPQVSKWPGILVGDMSQPRGGPMLTGHASHQIGLDADIWLTPMPKRAFTPEEREKISATMIVRPDRRDVDTAVWTPSHIAVIRAAAQDPDVERVLVNAAIKKALCRDATGDRTWLQKVRPYWGHDYHMHVRIACPEGSPDCRPQDPVTPGEGCGSALDWWFSEGNINPKPAPKPAKPPPPMMLKDLPPACRQVLLAP
ncbi:penicillin-insensitive murein endopeptidase [Ancylobacter radicis]|uniref:Penicillin-insensitive murein endopeptidase n=1 Tax=Ancylobacter radicis TaxID=2836179 RepID=A0ABS5R495_9HYPH|nr:penicillin-insensitive murein endopeptidase [Ancylobacter radicis]MBS9475634.1 penicillin-insensitive murein endopeptidase [Ancylobacter radicis]